MRVLVLAKAPLPGRAKTRLQSRWTAAQVAALAEASLADTLDAVVASGVPLEVVLDGPPGPWLPEGTALSAQVAGSHAQRIFAALSGRREPCVLIGMDTPQVTADLLRDACARLGTRAAVLGPAADGGWWALGLRDPARHGSLVLGIPTSTAATGALQRAALDEAGLAPSLLPVLRDVDEAPDALEVAGQAPDGRFGRLVHALESAAA